jgi:hypothetical protein
LCSKIKYQRINNPINKRENGLKRQFSKDVQINNKYMKKCSASLVMKEMQIKTTQILLHSSEGLSQGNKQQLLARMAGGRAYSLLVGMQISPTTMEFIREVPNKL